MEQPQRKQVVMSGMRPTGKLHLGHYYGVLKNWVKLQDDYHCYYSVVDWHALTTKLDDSRELKEDIYDMVLDWLAAGIDPDKATMFIQSAIPDFSDVHLWLSVLVAVIWVETDPTLKDMIAIVEGKKSDVDA